jgi:hypothetical protein
MKHGHEMWKVDVHFFRTTLIYAAFKKESPYAIGA